MELHGNETHSLRATASILTKLMQIMACKNSKIFMHAHMNISGLCCIWWSPYWTNEYAIFHLCITFPDKQKYVSTIAEPLNKNLFGMITPYSE